MQEREIIVEFEAALQKLAENIRQAREKADFTVEELALLSGVSIGKLIDSRWMIQMSKYPIYLSFFHL